MGDLIGFEGYLNVSTPYNRREHNALWKSDRRYNDFAFGNDELPHCDYPRFYGDDGKQVLNLSSELVGCRDSEFDQYGEVAAFGIYPEWYVYVMRRPCFKYVVRHALGMPSLPRRSYLRTQRSNGVSFDHTDFNIKATSTVKVRICSRPLARVETGSSRQTGAFFLYDLGHVGH